jgi:hypothetical protein
MIREHDVAVGESPVRHSASGIDNERLLETKNGLVHRFRSESVPQEPPLQAGHVRRRISGLFSTKSAWQAYASAARTVARKASKAGALPGNITSRRPAVIFSRTRSASVTPISISASGSASAKKDARAANSKRRHIVTKRSAVVGNGYLASTGEPPLIVQAQEVRFPEPLSRFDLGDHLLNGEISDTSCDAMVIVGLSDRHSWD